MAEIKAEEKTLSKVFGGDYLIEIPGYQRPYSWTTDHVSELFEDLRDAATRADETTYFLGSIIMIRTDDDRHHELIDGQQRLTTLTMLLCVARDLAPISDRDHIQKYIAQSADKFEGTKESPRLLVRSRDRHIFKEWVQNLGGTLDISASTGQGKSDSQQRMAENIESLRTSLEQLDPAERDDLVRFIVTQSYLIVATTSDRESAYRMFAILNNRGLNLSPTDILKAEVIGGLIEEQQQAGTDTWESLEDDLGRDRFRDLFQAICAIYVKDKIHSALQTEFQEKVLKNMRSDRFIDDVLTPYAEAYSVLVTNTYPSATPGHEINRVLRNIMSLDDYTVMPPALAFLRYQKGHDADGALAFFRKLERLTFCLRILRVGVEARIRRYAKIVRAIEEAAQNGVGDDELNPDLFELTVKEIHEVLKVLDGPIGEHRLCKHILLLLDGAVTDAGVHYDRPNCTIEHVLPQQPEEKSVWKEEFPDETIQLEWTQRLGNLVLLSRTKNSRASNFDFKKKRDQYFMKSNVTPFALTLDLKDENEWTMEVLTRRQEKLLGILKARWWL